MTDLEKEWGAKRTTVSLEDLARALQKGLPSRAMKWEESIEMAKYLLDFFGFATVIIDNVLRPKDRDAFYMLEDSGFLDTWTEYVFLPNGKQWRIHYWHLCTDRIHELAEKEEISENCGAEGEANVYDNIPDEAWSRAG